MDFFWLDVGSALAFVLVVVKSEEPIFFVSRKRRFFTAYHLHLALLGFFLACSPEALNDRELHEDQVESLDAHKLRSNFRIADDSTQLVYRFNSEKKMCMNAEGAPGRNLGLFAECGELKWVLAKNLDLSGKRLKGLWVENSDLSGMNASRADLEGAEFRNVILNNARFQNAHLESIQFMKIGAKFFMLAPRAFKGATISPDSRFPWKSSDPDVFSFNNLVAHKGAILKSVRELPWGSRFGHIKFDKNLSRTEVQILSHDLARLESLNLKVSRGTMYQQAFGGYDSRAVSRYLSGRVKRVEAVREKSSTIVASNYSIPQFLDHYESTLSTLILKNYWAILTIEKMLGEITEGTAEKTFLKVRKELPHPKPVPHFNDQPVNTTRPNIGTVTMGSLYFSTQLSSISRVGNLVHEARHSDCTEKPAGITYQSRLQKRLSQVHSDYRELRNLHFLVGSRPHVSGAKRKSLLEQVSAIRFSSAALVNQINALGKELDKYPECGHRHQTCSVRHPDQSLRGIEGACDEGTWGAYAVQAAFYEGVASSCLQCTESERQAVMIGHLDALNRISDLSGQRRDLRNGLSEEKMFGRLEGLEP